MGGQIYMIVDSSNAAVIQAGQPATAIAAWVLDVPDGSSAETVAEAFFLERNFPLNSAVYTVDAGLVTGYSVRAALTLLPEPPLDVTGITAQGAASGGDATLTIEA